MNRPMRTLATVILAAGALIGGLYGAPSLAQASPVDHGPALHHHRRPAVRSASPTAQQSVLTRVWCPQCTQVHPVRSSVGHTTWSTAALVHSAETLLAPRAGGHPIPIDLVHLLP